MLLKSCTTERKASLVRDAGGFSLIVPGSFAPDAFSAKCPLPEPLLLEPWAPAGSTRSAARSQSLAGLALAGALTLICPMTDSDPSVRRRSDAPSNGTSNFALRNATKGRVRLDARRLHPAPKNGNASGKLT